MSKVGILHPGAMGISIAVSMRTAGHAVYWVSEGRSTESRLRAEDHQLSQVPTLSELCAMCEIIICVCPPHAADDVAIQVIEAGFSGLYCDGNAIAPRKAGRIG